MNTVTLGAVTDRDTSTVAIVGSLHYERMFHNGPDTKFIDRGLMVGTVWGGWSGGVYRHVYQTTFYEGGGRPLGWDLFFDWPVLTEEEEADNERRKGSSFTIDWRW